MRIKGFLASEKSVYLFLFLIAFFFIINSTYSPVNFRRMHVDSSVYVTIAQNITRGFLPYSDLPDNKGPLLYLINAAGWKIGGFTGIWFMELVFMFASVFFAYKTALFFGSRLIAFLGVLFSLVVLYAFFTVNAGVEGYSMPFFMFSMYIFAKYFFASENKTRFFELIFLGASFTCAIMIRINAFSLWAGFCAVIFIELLVKKRYALLGKYALGFCLGIIAAGTPIFLYLFLNGILDDFVKHVIIGSVSRGFADTSLKAVATNFYSIINRTLSIIPLAVGFFWIITKFKRNMFSYSIGYFISYFLLILFLSFSTNLIHMNSILIPFFVPSLAFLVGATYSAFSDYKHKTLFTVLFFSLIFSEGIVNYLYDSSKILHDNSGAELINAGRIIEENTSVNDKIISFGGQAYIYPFVNRQPASRYFFQTSSFYFIPGAREEFISDILSVKPAIIALFTADDADRSGNAFIASDWHAPIFKMMETDYRLLSEDNGFKLFIRVQNEF